ncbi:hypothetical protein B6S44_22000 [Bosea sp. Tri-44]|uniref:TniQ family protein n=1 Tax=Bosea sp. Tri-44 TaxID=1972137 RepID=UPI00100F472B|nr:TniQ family protein [Bosea sp. Tri-44]RXT51278.1 hypothetical protein B6S44_22000 [Bosea sp. Tri-44]
MRINYVAVYPARQDGEPAYAHLMRVAQANGVKRVATLATNLGLESYRLHMRSSLETIAHVGRSDTVSLAHDTATDDRDIVTLRGETLRRGTQWASLGIRRACPACYAEDKRAVEPYKRRLPRAWHRTWWDVTAVTACPVHYCRLISRCPQCSEPFDPGRGSIDRCPNNHDISRFECVPADAQEVRSSAYIVGRLGGGPRINVPALDDMPLHWAIETMEVIGYAATERSFVKQHGDSRGASSQSCGIGLSVVEDLGIAAPKLVAGLREGAHTVRGSGKQKAYGGFDTWAFGLPDGALKRHLTKAIERDMAAAGIGRAIRIVPVEASGISLSKAAQMIGTNVDWVRRVAVEKGFIEPRRRWKGAPITLSEQTVEILRHEKDAWLNLEETAARLRVDVYAMRRLLDAGHLDGITSENPRFEATSGAHQWRISPETIDGFIAKLAGTLDESVSPSLSLIEASFAASKSLTRVVGLILRGHLCVCAIDEAAEGLARLKVRVVDIKTALQKDRGDMRTFLEASAEIGLTPAAAKEVRDAGYLPFTKTGRRYAVSKQDIDEFNDLYTTSSKLAEKFGLLGWQSADQLLRTIGVKAVGDRDFAKRFIYHRKETEEAIRGWSQSETKAESYSAGGWLTPKHALNQLQVPYILGMELIAAGILPSEDNSRGRRLSEEAVSEFRARYLTTVEAGELLGCTAQKAINLLREQKLVAGPPDYSGYLYERKSALEAIERLNSVVVEEPPRFEFDPDEHITASQITELVGINRDTITFLEKKGLLSSARQGGQFYFSATQLAAFRERYLGGRDVVEALAANTKDPGMNPVWFSKRLGLKSAFGPPEIKAYIFNRDEFVEAVRQYEVERQADEDRQAKIAEIPVLLSRDVGARLRIVSKLMANLVRAGILRGEKRGLSVVFTLEEVERFEKTYILATEASEHIGKKGSMTAVAALQRLGVPPIAPYSELGGYIYNREQALRALDGLTHNLWSAA